LDSFVHESDLLEVRKLSLNCPLLGVYIFCFVAEELRRFGRFLTSWLGIDLGEISTARGFVAVGCGIAGNIGMFAFELLVEVSWLMVTGSSDLFCF